MWAGDEWTRPLTDEGVSKTQRAVAGPKRIGIQPTHLLCSPLTRTRQTAEVDSPGAASHAAQGVDKKKSGT